MAPFTPLLRTEVPLLRGLDLTGITGADRYEDLLFVDGNSMYPARFGGADA